MINFEDFNFEKNTKVILDYLECKKEDISCVYESQVSKNKLKKFEKIFECDNNLERNILSTTFTFYKFGDKKFIRHTISNIMGGVYHVFYGKKEDVKSITAKPGKAKVESIHIPERYSDKLQSFIENARTNKYNIPLNRGLVLTGKPGNGKTRLLQWVANNYPCILYNDETIKGYKGPQYIDSKNAYIELYDDVDMSIFEEKHHLYNKMLSLFDCCYSTTVIRIFSTNQTIEYMSKAFLRPGRINEVLKIDPPEYNERKPLFEKFPVDLTEETEGMSYAEIQFLKVCLVNANFNVEEAFNYFDTKSTFETKSKVGFLNDKERTRKLVGRMQMS